MPENTEKGNPENTPSSNQLQELLVEQVVPNPNQPRKVMDPEAIKELASSIQSEGLLQPIVVRPTESGYELIAGERRWRAHQQLGRATILARILEVTDLSSASLSLIENLQREQLNPVEEAMGYQSLISDFNLSQQEVSLRMGKSRSHIANLMRLLQLDGELKDYWPMENYLLVTPRFCLVLMIRIADWKLVVRQCLKDGRSGKLKTHWQKDLLHPVVGPPVE